MDLSIVTGVCGRNEITKRWLDTTIKNCSSSIHELVIVDNGSSEEDHLELVEMVYKETKWENIKIIYCNEPLGSSAALNKGIGYATGKIICMPHNDLLIKEEEWDVKLFNFFEETPNAGVVGFAGGKSLGAPDIYRTPYFLPQLARGYVYTSLEDWPSHGQHCVEPTKVAVLDGLTICVRKEVLEEIGEFDENMIHHMYDNDISLKALEFGYDNYVVPILCQHISGQTANFPKYNEWLRKQGKDGDGQVHKESHEYFYEKWAPGKRGLTLPVKVE